ncbi:alpha/beta hydrolase [Flavobacterium psychrophilum]|uniref:alpha/beta hydrolase n=1 Tax=Flavobacterium psychrophilum TaxID=96345 RepID=UPI00106D7319|nr:alpha/beta hydrolase-fold protein [Flavobacterium psychrophilum]
MKKIILVLFFINLYSFAQEKDFVLGKIETLNSLELNEIRTINIYLPEGYNKEENYPVIYLLDGSAHEDFIHIVGLVQYCNFEWIKLLPKSIVVGIENVDRKRDFTYPTTVEKDKKEYPTTGGSKKFISFIEKEVQPFIENKYKTTTSKTIIGQSLGGLLATEILFKKPDLFSNYIIISPSLWWDKESLLKQASIFLDSHFNQKTTIFIGVGNEGKIMINDAENLFEIIKNKPMVNAKYNYFSEKKNGDILHTAVFKAFEVLKL